jgi:hypothetical protein
MDADDDQFVNKLLTQTAQLRHIMVTVNSAKRVELQQDNFAPKLRQREGVGRVQPFQFR